jgi:multiple sugar transport system substrate-binding protein
VVSACSSSSTPAPTAGGTSSVPGTTAPTAAPTYSVNAITGTAILSGWQSSQAEGNALLNAVAGFEHAYPNVAINYQPVSGDYPTALAADFASKNVPDLIYVDASYASTWISQGYLLPLDNYIKESNFDTSKFFPGYANIFKGADGKTYGLPKDGNTIAMAYNTAMVTSAPTTMDALVTLAQSLKGKNGLKAPMCLNPGLDRGLAFLYAQGGSIESSDGKTETIDSAASKTAVQWYMDLFKNGLGMTASDLGDGWCGDALGKGQVAMIFEGGWLDPAMSSTYPTIKYAWAPMPTGTSGSPVTISYTVSYSIPADAKNPDQAWVLMQYLTGKDGMTLWTQGGVALPARSDVPTPAGKDVLAASSAFAKPGSGFMPSYDKVQTAFQNEFTNQIQKKTFDAGAVVSATAPVITTALNG